MIDVRPVALLASRVREKVLLVPPVRRKPHWSKPQGIERSAFVPFSGSTLVRFVRNDEGVSRWILVGSQPDRELALAGGGALLAGPEIDLSPLDPSERDALEWYVQGPGLERPKEERDFHVSALLKQCPRSRCLPPIDLDVADGHTRAEALAWARALEPALARRGLGVPSWHRTGSPKGVHGDLLAPEGFSSPDLLEIARVLVVEAAREVGIPLLSDHPAVEGRAPVVVDDRLFRRNPEGRGVVWRLSGALKPTTGGVKTPIDLWDREVAYAPPVPGELAAFERAAAVVQRQKELDGALHRRKRVGARTIKPLELPAGTVLLPRFAEAFGRALAMTAARHEVRLAAAGWLLGLGVAAAVVEATLAKATGNAEDAHDAVDSTASRLASGAPCKALPALQALLGGAACVELRNALVQDGVTRARKTYWTDRERERSLRVARSLPQDHPGRNALRDGARCGTFSLPYDCEVHGPQGMRANVEERELTCPHCREARIAARVAIMRETWLPGTRYQDWHAKDDRGRWGAWKEGTLGVLEIRLRASDHPIDGLKPARRAAKVLTKLVAARRWFMGVGRVLAIFPATEVAFLKKKLAKLASSPDAEVMRRSGYTERELEAVRGYGLTAESAQVVTLERALGLVSEIWTSPGVAFQGLVETEDEEGVAAFPWLCRKNVVKTSATKIGRERFPWPSGKVIREQAKLRAIEARGGIDPNVCDHAVDFDEWGLPVVCGAPYRVHVDHLPTGVRLSGEHPFVGRFPRKLELATLLAAADPEILRAGYEQQRALGRRR